MNFPVWLQSILLRAPGLLVGITVHEFFHAWTAWKLGDDTPMEHGRVTLNPLAHLDPIGTLLILFGPFGWGKPVPVNPQNFRQPRRDDLLVALLGPVSNFAVAIGFAIVAMGVVRFFTAASSSLLPEALRYAVQINVALMIFNLVPLYPLDGSHVLAALLPPRAHAAFNEFSRFAPFVLLGMLAFEWYSGVPLFFGLVLGPAIAVVSALIFAAFGLL